MGAARFVAFLSALALAGCPAPAVPPVEDAGIDVAMDAPFADAGTTTYGTDRDRDRDGVESLVCGGADCDDDDPRRRPDALEICDPDGLDEDCDFETFGPRDADGDGLVAAVCCNTDPDGALHCGADCDDTRRTVSPDSPEVCDDLDNDCDGAIDEMVETRYFRDDDVDGHGVAADFLDTCAPMGAYRSTIGDDCDDADSLIHPGAAERCNALDDDCSDGGGAEPAEDADGDLHTATSFTACETGFPRDDCDDGRALLHPGADFQPEPWCSSFTPCLSGGVWVCGMRAAGSQACSDTLTGAPAPSWDFDCDGGVALVARGRFCVNDCLTGCPPTVVGTVGAHTVGECGMPVPHFECSGDCASCAATDLGDLPLGCR